MHINNALHEELASDPTGANFATIENSKNSTVAKFAIVQKEGGRLGKSPLARMAVPI